MKLLSELKPLPEFAPIFAVLDSTLLESQNQDFLQAVSDIIKQVNFAPVYGLYIQEISHIIFNHQGEQLTPDGEHPPYTLFCESGIILSLGTTLHAIHWDSIVGHQPLTVNTDDNPEPMLMHKILIDNNELISQAVIQSPQAFLMLDAIMRGFARLAQSEQNQ